MFRIRSIVSGLFSRFAQKILPNTIDQNYLDWVKINGDKSLRLNYNLTKQSIVIDAGGYEGQWASDIYSKYRCKVYVFEPVSSFFNSITDRFKSNTDIVIYPFGVSDKAQELEIAISNDGSSTFGTSNEKERIRLVDFVGFCKNEKIECIDLIKINIEGGEYDLLDHILASGMIKKIKNIQVQFHRFVPNSEFRMRQIQSELSKTHCFTYQYNFIWENWLIKQ
jgi:FkbM family methyltransferase